MTVRRIVWGTLAILALGFIFWPRSTPGLLTLPSGTSVTGCDGRRDENATSVCPRLFCQKALREHPRIGDRAEIQLIHSLIPADGSAAIHAGQARWSDDGVNKQTNVRCLMQGDTIIKAGPVSTDEFNRIVAGHERF